MRKTPQPPRRLYRLRARELVLPPDRICPKCKRIILESRRWVSKDELTCCLKCYRSLIRKDAQDEGEA